MTPIPGQQVWYNRDGEVCIAWIVSVDAAGSVAVLLVASRVAGLAWIDAPPYGPPVGVDTVGAVGAWWA